MREQVVAMKHNTDFAAQATQVNERVTDPATTGLNQPAVYDLEARSRR